MAATIPIPGPPGVPLLGNITDINPSDSVGSLGQIADTYGEIFKLIMGGKERVFISSQALLNEVCDEKRFEKAVSGALYQIRNAVEDGLFTAFSGEHNWEIAHRTLMPAFGPLSIRSMYDEMYDIATQLVVKWARYGDKERIEVTSDFTRLTLDSIALCAMGTRFNSFYQETMHPFVGAMVGMLQESGNRASRLSFANYFMRSSQQKYDADIALLKKVAAEVVAERRKFPSDKKDLLNAMILGKDPKTGEAMSEESIINNMITFLIAGHETTSGMLSFLFYQLLKNPSAYQAAQSEVDRVIGRGPITVEHMSNLPYLAACLRETLRLNPTAPAFTLQPIHNTTEQPILIGGGKYQIEKGQPITALLGKVHRDPKVYGDDAEEFKPERMLDEPFSKLPPNSWKPFGNGMRGCIGRPFAWQEALLCTAILLQNFDFRFDDPSYTLRIKQTLTTKPKDFYMHAKLREHIDPVHLEKMLHVDSSKEKSLHENDKAVLNSPAVVKKDPMTILYGSNSGTCEALAQNLARTAGSKGFNVQVGTLDSAVDKVPKDQPLVLISSSYEGQPPDNAVHFVNWLRNLKGGNALSGVKYTVYGVGNHDWTNTFHKVPKDLDTLFAANGATRLASTGLGDVAAGDIFNDFDKWQDTSFWTVFGDRKDTEDGSDLEIEIDTSLRHTTLRQDVKEAIVLSNEVLTEPGVREKRHIILKLPTGMTYKVGDYLAVLPMNNMKTIHRVLKRFRLPWDAVLTIKTGANTTLPTGRPVSAMEILGMYVELSNPATRKNVQQIASSIPDKGEREELLSLTGDKFNTEIGAKRLSPLDILESHPTAELPLSSFLAMLPPMRIRQYSISSSPLVDPTKASLTWSVLDTPTTVTLPTGEKTTKRFLGVASNYLSGLESTDLVHVAVKPSHGSFHLPADIETTPIIMLCAGTGLAPFRGFVEERAIQHAAGRKLAPAYLFIGCSHPGRDRLFGAELDQWQKDGVVTLFYAHSKDKESSKGCQYVQDRLWEEREEMTRVFDQGARIYVCGSAQVGDGVSEVVKKIYGEVLEKKGKKMTETEIDEWWAKVKSDRYASDVFA